MPFRLLPDADPRSVLHLSQSHAEWLELVAGREPRYARVAVGGAGAAEMAHAALEARRASGSTATRCVLALGTGVVAQRHMTLPRAARRELGAVLTRRAAQLAGCPAGDALYAGLPGARDERPGAAGEGQECHWTLLALRRSFARELASRLGRAGVRASRVVAARLAVLSHVDRALGPAGGATLVIDFEPGATVLSLIDGARVVHQTTLDGDVVEQPGLALAIVQEARSFESAWRRESRGAPLARACVIGLAPEGAGLFRNALSNALPGVETVQLGGDRAGERAGRFATLEACLARGRFDLDLTVPVPWPTGRRVACALAACALVASLGVVATRGVERERQALEHGLRARLARTADLEELELALADAAASRAALEGAVERFGERLGTGLPLAGILEDALGAFGADVALLAVHAGRGATEVSLVGEAHPHPLRMAAALDRAARALEASPSFAAVEVHPPDELPTAAEVRVGTPVEVALLAELEVGP